MFWGRRRVVMPKGLEFGLRQWLDIWTIESVDHFPIEEAGPESLGAVSMNFRRALVNDAAIRPETYLAFGPVLIVYLDSERHATPNRAGAKRVLHVPHEPV